MCGATTSKKMEWRRRELCGQNLGVQQSAPTVRLDYHTILVEDPLMHITVLDAEPWFGLAPWLDLASWLGLAWSGLSQ